MPTTEEDLQQKRERNEKLREQIAAEEAKRRDRELDLSNQIVGQELDAEGARLEAELASLKESSKVANVKSGAEAPLQSAKEAMEQALAQQKAQEEAAAAAKADDEKKEN